MEKPVSEKKEKVSAERRMIQSDEIFAGTSEVVIRHNLDYYRLMITKAGKLILNK